MTIQTLSLSEISAVNGGNLVFDRTFLDDLPTILDDIIIGPFSNPAYAPGVFDRPLIFAIGILTTLLGDAIAHGYLKTT